MNTAEKVARLEAYLQRLQTNAKLPRPQRGPSIPLTDVAAKAATGGETPGLLQAAQSAASDLEAHRISVERTLKEASERAAREVAASAAAARVASENAAREASERVAKDAAERAAREIAAKAARDEAERAAKEKAAKDAAEKAAKDAAAAKEAAEKAARDAAAAKDAAERAAAKDAAEKAAKDAAAAKEAADKGAKEVAAAKEAADKVAKEKAAAEKATEKAAADKAAADKVAKEVAAAKEAAERAAKDKAAKDAAERAAKEKATKEAAERAAKEATERAAKSAASVPPKKEPSTIDELFAELEFTGEPTKVGPAVQTPAASPKPSPVRAAAPPALPDSIKDETTIDGELPTVVGSMDELPAMARRDADAPVRSAPPPLPMDAPTRVADTYSSLLDPPTLDSPTIVYGDKPGVDRSPELDEPTVIRRPSAHDRAVLRGEEPDAADANDEEPTVVRHLPEDEPSNGGEDAPTLAFDKAKPMTEGELIEPSPIITVGDVAAAEDAARDEKSGLPRSPVGHGPKVELAEPLREAAEMAAKAAAEKAAKEAALRPKPVAKEQVREEVTTASRRMVELTPETIAAEKKERAREDATKPGRGWGSTLGLLLVTVLLVGAGVYLGLQNGWFGSSGPPSPTTTQTGATAPTMTAPRTSLPVQSGAPTVAQTAVPTGAPSTSASVAPSVEPTAAPAINPAAAGQPGVPIVEKPAEALKLNATKGFLTLVSPEDGFVYVTGKKIGAANQRHEVSCGVGLVRFGVPLPNGGVDWRSPPGMSIPIPCRASTTIAITPSKGPWPVPGGNRLPAGGGDPY